MSHRIESPNAVQKVVTGIDRGHTKEVFLKVQYSFCCVSACQREVRENEMFIASRFLFCNR